MSKLTDAQLVLLSQASQREDRAIDVAKLKKKPDAKTVATLIEQKLLAEVHAKPPMPIFRRDDNKVPLSLVITDFGLVAIGVSSVPDPKSSNRSKGRDKRTDRPAKTKVAAGTKQKSRSASPVGKTGLVVQTLRLN